MVMGANWVSTFYTLLDKSDEHNVGSDSVDFVDKKMINKFHNLELRWQRKQQEQVVEAGCYDRAWRLRLLMVIKSEN